MPLCLLLPSLLARSHRLSSSITSTSLPPPSTPLTLLFSALLLIARLSECGRCACRDDEVAALVSAGLVFVLWCWRRTPSPPSHLSNRARTPLPSSLPPSPPIDPSSHPFRLVLTCHPSLLSLSRSLTTDPVCARPGSLVTTRPEPSSREYIVSSSRVPSSLAVRHRAAEICTAARSRLPSSRESRRPGGAREGWCRIG